MDVKEKKKGKGFELFIFAVMILVPIVIDDMARALVGKIAFWRPKL